VVSASSTTTETLYLFGLVVRWGTAVPGSNYGKQPKVRGAGRGGSQ